MTPVDIWHIESAAEQEAAKTGAVDEEAASDLSFAIQRQGADIATPGITRIFVADGLLLMFALYVVIMLVEALRKRLRSTAPWTTLAVILAAVLGLMMKFGFKTLSAF